MKNSPLPSLPQSAIFIQTWRHNLQGKNMLKERYLKVTDEELKKHSVERGSKKGKSKKVSAKCTCTRIYKGGSEAIYLCFSNSEGTWVSRGVGYRTSFDSEEKRLGNPQNYTDEPYLQETVSMKEIRVFRL